MTISLQIGLASVGFLLIVIHFWLLASIRVDCHRIRTTLWGYMERAKARHIELIDKIVGSSRSMNEKVWGVTHETDRILLELEKLAPHDIGIAASILEAHFRKKKDEEGLMLVTTLRNLLQRKPPKKSKRISNCERHEELSS